MLDIREPYEFDCMHIDGSHNVPCSGHQERARFRVSLNSKLFV
ncbi:MAG: hypothetical protein ACJ0BM_06210 [bacterium]